jgi:hypothetical protein
MLRKIHFLENDYKCPASDEDIRTGKRRLRYCGLPTEDIENMEIHYQFGLMEKDDVYKIIFDKNNILATYSMYVSGSDGQILSLLAGAGRNGIKDIVYIDSSGQLAEFLNGTLKGESYVYAIGCAINSNTILTYDYKTDSVKKIKFELNGYWDDCITLEDFDILNLLSTNIEE